MDEQTTAAVAQLLRVGQKLRFFWSEGNINNHTLEIRAIVDDDYIVTRTWSRSRQRWYYEVQPRSWFELNYHDGTMTPTR